MTIGNHECHIVFCDDRVGEMEYVIKGKANLPVQEYVNELIKISLEKKQEISINIPFLNKQRE